MIEADPAYGAIVCFCERVSRGEIRDALAGPIPPSDLDGLRRRTRATMGRCQGFYCGADVDSLLRGARAVSAPDETVEVRRCRCRTGRSHRGAESCAAWVHGQSSSSSERHEAGGIPRHSNHTGYGLRDLRRVMSGPRLRASGSPTEPWTSAQTYAPSRW